MTSIHQLTKNLRDKTDEEVLEGIADIIEADPTRWTQGVNFMMEDGTCLTNPNLAHSACAVGFIDAVYPIEIHWERNWNLVSMMQENIPKKYGTPGTRYNLTKYNDTRRDAAEVIAWFRRAAAQAG